jgi:hypothetical protein
MIKSCILSLVIALLCGAGALHAADLPSSTGTPHMDFESDSAQYSRSSETLTLTGNVRLTEKERPGGLPDRTMRGNYFVVMPSSGVIISSGPLLMQEAGNAIYGENGDFNWHNRQGSMRNVTSTYGVWRILDAQQAQFDGEIHHYKDLSITTCGEKTPDYTIHLSRLTVIPGDYLFGTNAVMYIHKIPVMYLPIVYKPLGNGGDFVTYLDVGEDSTNGFYTRTSTVYDPSKNLVTKLFLDYYTKSHLGTGGEVDYNESGETRSTLDFYRIRQPGDLQDRWGFSGGLWHKLGDDMTCPSCNGALYYIQSQLRMVSDPNFNNDYFRSNPYAISTNRNASAAVVRQTKITTTRISYIRQDTASADMTYFIKTQESRPRIDFQTAPLAGPLKLTNVFTASYDKTETNTTNYYLGTGEARWTVQKSVPLQKNVSLFTSVFYDQTVYFAPQTPDTLGTQNNQDIGRYGTTANIRNKLSSTEYIDLGYGFTQRLSTNTWSVDGKSEDTGEELNMATVKYYYRPTPSVYFQTTSGFDFRNLQNTTTTWAFSDRLQPVSAETGWDVSSNVFVFGRDMYQMGQGNQAFLVQADLGSRDANMMSVGLSNYKSTPRAFMINQAFVWRPSSSTWHVEAGINWQVNTTGVGISDISLPMKTLTFAKDYHDFHTEWHLQKRPGVTTLSAKINVRFNAPGQRVSGNREAQNFWYPWRRDDEVRD